jgi:hypothetical protein
MKTTLRGLHKQHVEIELDERDVLDKAVEILMCAHALQAEDWLVDGEKIFRDVGGQGLLVHYADDTDKALFDVVDFIKHVRYYKLKE